MSNNAHFFDIDCLIRVENKAWVIDKKNPKVPLLKLSKSDLHLIENGIYKNQNNKIEFNGKTFWLPTNLYNKIKVKAKVNKTDLNSLAISLQEFYNAPVIDELEFEFNLDTILTLKNTQPNIYVICSKQTKKNYSTIVEKLKEELIQHGLKIKTFYYISDSFYNIDNDEVKFKKIRLLLQHLIGYKTASNSFSNEGITPYHKIYFYDDQMDTIELSKQINPLLNYLYENTRKGLKDVVKENIQEFEPCLIINRVNDNLYNRLETTKVILELSKFVKTFETFRFLDNITKFS
jgi:hypothetical protein